MSETTLDYLILRRAAVKGVGSLLYLPPIWGYVSLRWLGRHGYV